ncbi:hypothetical protein AXG93_3571s1030 [Marchantia polymorpha subsp. ruderalis]|uniref:Uncharacterized protein n=1 Tax=Marchantia polymorpha subsp. ruderalis TaxID=1480154 RepID=A0A176VQ57_MARPO|nr:hypothetical protein AXG93_3571s1030 [Marchantia polymorpha subsp. ruderalis]
MSRNGGEFACRMAMGGSSSAGMLTRQRHAPLCSWRTSYLEDPAAQGTIEPTWTRLTVSPDSGSKQAGKQGGRRTAAGAAGRTHTFFASLDFRPFGACVLSMHVPHPSEIQISRNTISSFACDAIQILERLRAPLDYIEGLVLGEAFRTAFRQVGPGGGLLSSGELRLHSQLKDEALISQVLKELVSRFFR